MKTTVRSVMALGTCAAIAMGVGGVASADTVIRFKDSVVSQKLGANTVTIRVNGQSARLSPGMVALPSTRNAWVSGAITVDISGPDADGGTIEAGYVVGCQVNIGDAGLSVSSGANGPVLHSSEDDASIADAGASTGGSLSLSAGTIGLQSLTFDRKTWPAPGDDIEPGWNDPSTSYDFEGSKGSLAFADQTIGVDGCAGYAQARLYVYASVQAGDHEGTVALWGKPFSLG